MKKEIYFAALLLTLLWGCSDTTSTQQAATQTASDTTASPGTGSSQQAAGGITEAKTKEVLDHHWEAFIQNNLEAVMADYTDESVLITPDVTYKGLAEIQKNFENAFKAFPKDQTSFKLNKSVLQGEVAYILWQAKTPTFNLTYATDTFIVKDGKIISQTYAGVAQALKK